MDANLVRRPALLADAPAQNYTVQPLAIMIMSGGRLASGAADGCRGVVACVCFGGGACVTGPHAQRACLLCNARMMMERESVPLSRLQPLLSPASASD